MSRNIRYIFVILTAVFVTFIILISRFYFKVDSVIKKDGYEANQSESQNNFLTVFTDDNGLKGMKNSNNVIVVQAKWDSIIQIPGSKFIVSLKDNQNVKYGVVDIAETVLIPVIYANIEYIDRDGYFVGKTENNSYVLMNADGSAIIEKEWDNYFKKDVSSDLLSSDNYIQLESGKDVYRIRSINNIMSISYICINRKICGYNKEIEIRNINQSTNIKEIPKYYTEVIDTSISYVTSLFSSDATQIRKMSFDDNYKQIQLDELGIRGAKLRYVDTIWPFVEDDKDGKTSFSCNIFLMYTVPGTIQWDGSYNNTYDTAVFHIRMDKDQDGILKICDVNLEKVDPSKLDIPEECFDKEDQDDENNSSADNQSSDDSQRRDVVTG